MKHTIQDTTFGGVQFDAVVAVDDAKRDEYAAKFKLYHIVNGAVEKTMGNRKVKFTTETGRKLTDAYHKAGVEVTNVREYIPQPSEPARKMATALYEGAKAKGTLAALQALFGFPNGLNAEQTVEAIHDAMRKK